MGEKDKGTKGTRSEKDCEVLMYPDNQLGEQKREFKDTLRLSTILRAEFFDK